MTSDPLNDPRNWPSGIGTQTPSPGSHRWPINTTEGRKYAVETRVLASGQVAVVDEGGREWTASWETPHLHEPYTPEGEGE